MNAVEIEAAIAALAEQPFDAAEFPFTFLEAFGNKVETTIKRLRGKHNKSDVEGGVLQRNNIHLATCEAGQVEATLKALLASPKTTDPRARIKFVLATDGQWLEAEDLTSGETLATAFTDLAEHFAFFLPLAVWVACETWGFGALSTPGTSKNRCIRPLPQETPMIRGFSRFLTWLRSLNYLRNACAHYARLWNRNIIDQPSLSGTGAPAAWEAVRENIQTADTKNPSAI